MEILAAANFITKLSVSLQPRLKRCNICYAHNANNPGFPVRYIPKKSPDDKQAQGSRCGDDFDQDGRPASSVSNLHQSTVEKKFTFKTQNSSARLGTDAENEPNQGCKGFMETKHIKPLQVVSPEWQKGHGNGQSLHEWDGEIGFTDRVVDSMNAKISGKFQVRKGFGQGQRLKLNQETGYDNGTMNAECVDVPEEADQEIPNFYGSGQGKQGRSMDSKTKQDVEKLAVELLAKRAFTAVELQKKLKAKHFPLNVVQAVVHDFQARGLINDQLYAETFSQSRWTSLSWGPRRIKQALLKKGVSEVDVENAAKRVFNDGEDNGDQRSSLKLSETSIKKLYVQASKQWQRNKSAPHETRKARVIRWLQYRGFDWGVVSIILKKLESQQPP